MIKILTTFLLVSFYLPFLSYSQEETYNIDKHYSISQLQTDFNQLRYIFETQHPRPYEFTTKERFDLFFDSLYKTIDCEMTEREFQFILAQIIAKIHCAHTKLYPSQYLTAHFNDYFKAPPFRLYFNEGRAYLRNNYSSDTSMRLGGRNIVR